MTSREVKSASHSCGWRILVPDAELVKLICVCWYIQMTCILITDYFVYDSLRRLKKALYFS